MASSRDRRSPTQGLIPPPAAAPRRRGPAGNQDASMSIPEGEQAPPVPPRWTSLARNDEGPGNAAPEIGFRHSPASQGSRQANFGKSQSLFSKDSAPIAPPSAGTDHRFSLPSAETNISGYHPDLQGLDFSPFKFADTNNSAQSTSAAHHEDVQGSHKSVYPDISQAFKSIAAPQAPVSNNFSNLTSPHFPVQGVMSAPPSRATPPPNPAQTSGSFAWDPPTMMNYGTTAVNSGAFSTSTASTSPYPSSFPAPFPPSCQPFPYSRVDSPISFSAKQQPPVGQPSYDYFSLFPPVPNRPGLSANTTFAASNYAPAAAYDLNPATSNFNLTPGTNMPRSASLNDVLEASGGPSFLVNNQEPHPMVVGGFDESLLPVNQSQNQASRSDLIDLGESLPEHEYLSLDYFDPLYSRARKESVREFGAPPSTNAGQSNFSFGEAFPNLYKEHDSTKAAACEHQNDDHIWLPTNNTGQSATAQLPIGFEAFDFDAFGHEKFGRSEEEFLKDVAHPAFTSPAYDFTSPAYDFTSPAYDSPANESRRKSVKKPERPPSWKVPQGKRYEKLRKRTFIDPESESFCQMVAGLKKKYLSTDERTNSGYLVNQIRECHMGSLQVKVIVYTSFATDPVAFTCVTSTLVEHVISHVLYTLAPSDLQPNTDKFIMKVYDKAEYLCNDLPLAKFDYTHTCLKLDHDIYLELVSCEEVSRPFIRTSDDDHQILYFPKEYINADGTAITQDALSVILDTFYHEVDVLLEHFTKGGTGTFHTQGLCQSVKAICTSLAKVETVEISKGLDKLERNVKDLLSPTSRSQAMYGNSSSQDKDTQDAINVAVRCSLVEDLEETVDQLVDGVKRLVCMYCRTFLTDFFLGSSIEIPHDHLEVVKTQDNFIVCISSAHRIPTSWATKYEEYKIVCSLYHGTKRLIPDISTVLKPLSTGLCERITWDQWLQFERTYLCTVPRETRLCLMLCGVSSTVQSVGEKNSDKGEVTEDRRITYPLGAAAIQLFNEKGYLNQGPQLIPLMMGVSSDPIMPSCKTLLPDSVLLQVNLPDFERTIFFPEPLNAPPSPTRSFDTLTPMIRSMVCNVMEKESCLTFTAEELEILWRHRHYMTDHPSLLPRILQAAESWDWASLSEIYALLRSWKPLHPMQAFELLLPQFPDLRVREFAAESLNKIPTDDLVDFLPQMIQGLKFESYHNSPLAKLLLEQSCKSPRFAHQFFWLLKGAASQDATFKRRYELMFVALASVAGDSLYQEFKKQEELVKIMTSVAEKVQIAKDKEATLRRELVPMHELVENKGRMLLPYNPSVEVVGLEMKSCSYFTSNAFPLKLVFKNSNPRADSHYVIYKVGDDLRQDMLTLQMIRIMDNLWLQQGLDLKLITFACLATGPKKGVIELITESDTLRKIQVSCGVTGSFKDRPIKEWLQKHNPTELEYKKAVENFTCSCAGYCVATYVLGICDRHNDNIMLKQSGHMFHIDFSKFLGDAQMFGSFKRDRVPFVLTSDMAYVINDGGRPGHKFQHFIDLCCQAFNILRKHSDLFRSLFILMARSGIPGVTERAVQYVQNALLPGQTDAQATATFTRMIEESMKSVFTQFNFFIHNLAQLKFSSHREGALLSFVPKSYSAETDGKITHVEMFGYQKRYTPEKHYIFILKIERENQKVPMYIFRHFSEFVEFRDKLNELFPLITWPNFSTRVVIGRSNIRTVAESRKTEIGHFLRYLWDKTAEISQCELVYTFFHPLLRDEQEAEKNKLTVSKLREPLVRPVNTGNSGTQGDIKLSVQYKKDALQVMIMHVRGLPEGSELPSPYVKTYLLPDPEKHTKLKTKTVKNTSHPTFNELLQYQLTQQELNYRVLQVTVWDRDMLKENNFLGAVYIKLRNLDLAKDNTSWHKLGRIQMSDA